MMVKTGIDDGDMYQGRHMGMADVMYLRFDCPANTPVAPWLLERDGSGEAWKFGSSACVLTCFLRS
jgi:hypothetical protein